MELKIKGQGIEIAAGSDLDNPEMQEYGFTEIESVQALDDDGEEVFASQAETFKTENSYDLSFLELDTVRIDHESIEMVWYDIDEWDPALLVFEKSTFNTPEGDIEVITCRYDEQCEDEMTPEDLESSTVWSQESGEWEEVY